MLHENSSAVGDAQIPLGIKFNPTFAILGVSEALFERIRWASLSFRKARVRLVEGYRREAEYFLKVVDSYCVEFLSAVRLLLLNEGFEGGDALIASKV